MASASLNAIDNRPGRQYFAE